MHAHARTAATRSGPTGQKPPRPGVRTAAVGWRPRCRPCSVTAATPTSRSSCCDRRRARACFDSGKKRTGECCPTVRASRWTAVAWCGNTLDQAASCWAARQARLLVSFYVDRPKTHTHTQVFFIWTFLSACRFPVARAPVDTGRTYCMRAWCRVCSATNGLHASGCKSAPARPRRTRGGCAMACCVFVRLRRLQSSAAGRASSVCVWTRLIRPIQMSRNGRWAAPILRASTRLTIKSADFVSDWLETCAI